MAPLENATKTAEGVVVNGFVVSPIIDKCEGCDRIREFDGQQFCSSYPQPDRKWAGGRCNFATHAKVQTTAAAKVNPLTAAKRAAKGR
ncbi:MAG: PxxKW family cysteine-rich protein [Desulfovibrionaceae bacterium]|nr:PxxKW family cysteine-rich protein [Desulfovibrionaceae bacterium]